MVLQASSQGIHSIQFEYDSQTSLLNIPQIRMQTAPSKQGMFARLFSTLQKEGVCCRVYQFDVPGALTLSRHHASPCGQRIPECSPIRNVRSFSPLAWRSHIYVSRVFAFDASFHGMIPSFSVRVCLQYAFLT